MRWVRLWQRKRSEVNRRCAAFGLLTQVRLREKPLLTGVGAVGRGGGRGRTGRGGCGVPAAGENHLTLISPNPASDQRFA